MVSLCAHLVVMIKNVAIPRGKHDNYEIHALLYSEEVRSATIGCVYLWYELPVKKYPAWNVLYV